MKRKIIIIAVIIMLVICVGFFMFIPKKIDKAPELSQVRAICNLATLKTYYHNVAKLGKSKDWIFQRDRELWIEYTGIATVGIDMSKVELNVNGNKVSVILPKAKLLNIDIDEEKINEDSYFYSQDNKVLFKNEITAEEQTNAINQAQNEMKSSVEGNEQLLKMAQERAKDLIERYISQLGELSNKIYNIEWSIEE